MNTENTWVGRVANRSVNGSCRNKKKRKERENNKTALEKKKSSTYQFNRLWQKKTSTRCWLEYTVQEAQNDKHILEKVKLQRTKEKQVASYSSERKKKENKAGNIQKKKKNSHVRTQLIWASMNT